MVRGGSVGVCHPGTGRRFLDQVTCQQMPSVPRNSTTDLSHTHTHMLGDLKCLTADLSHTHIHIIPLICIIIYFFKYLSIYLLLVVVFNSGTLLLIGKLPKLIKKRKRKIFIFL